MVDKPETLTTNEARGGVGLNVVRWVLIISVALAVIAMVVSYAMAPDSTVEGSDRAYSQPGQDRPVENGGATPGGGPAQGDATPR